MKVRKDGVLETVPISAASLPLPTGAATEATLATLLTLAGFQARINTFGQKTMANSTPVVLPSDQTAVPVDPSASFTGIADGAKTVAVAGTAEALVASSTPCKRIVMTAEDDNSGNIYYGGSGVSSASGDFLFPAQKITIDIDDVQKVFIDVGVSGDGVKFTYFT